MKEQLGIKTEVICAFPGTGKSYYCNLDYMPGRFAIDSDSSKFDKSAFPENYIKHIVDNFGKVCKIFVSTHKEIREALVKAGIDFKLIYPDENLREEYINRFRERGSSEQFIKLVSDNWDVWINELKNQKNCTHITLGAGQHVSNVV